LYILGATNREKDKTMITQYTFYILAALMLFTAVRTVLAKNPIHSVLYLIVTFFIMAAHYVLLNAQFLAVVHIIVYAGAIMVLFLFVLMLLNLNQDSEPHKPTMWKVAATMASGLLGVTLVGALKGSVQLAPTVANNGDLGLVKNLGKVLFTDYVVPFEIAGILFLAAMVGAVLVGKRDLSL
jgi:NADH-quinone oxidoreductase subunit J